MRSPRIKGNIHIVPFLYCLSNEIGNFFLAVRVISHKYVVVESLLIKSQALFENFCEVILWHNSKTASSAGQKESRNRRNDYSFCSRLRRCAFTLP